MHDAIRGFDRYQFCMPINCLALSRSKRSQRGRDVVSRKLHGAAGNFDVDLTPPASGIECSQRRPERQLPPWSLPSRIL